MEAPILLKLAALALVAAAPSSASTRAPQEDPEPLPEELRNATLHGPQKRAVNLWLTNRQIKGDVAYDTKEKRVSIGWVFTVAGLHDGILVDPTKGFAEQALDIPFWPTEIVGFGDDRLAVAGVTTGGAVTIRVFQFEQGSVPSVTADAEGKRVIPQLEVPVLGVTTVYEKPLEHVAPIAFLFRDLAAPTGLYFQEVQGDLKHLDTTTGRVALVASPAKAGAGVLEIPQLRMAWQDADFGAHRDIGHHYELYVPDRPMSPIDPLSWVLVIRDRDGDGTLDDWVMLDEPDEWSPYGDAAEHIDRSWK